MKMKIFLSMLIMTTLVFSNASMNIFADKVTSEANVVVNDDVVSGSAVYELDNNIDMDFNVISRWEDGFNGEITINNISDTTIENWQIQFEFPHNISNIWNATVVSQKDSTYIVKNAGGNNSVNIPVGESVVFGFTGTCEGEISKPRNVKLLAYSNVANVAEYTVDYFVLSDWGDGYSAQIIITNNTEADMEGWHIAFDYDGEIVNIWNAVIENHMDKRYNIINAGYNSVIPAKCSISFGFNGEPGNITGKPDNFELVVSGANDCSEKADDKNSDEAEVSNSDYYLVDIGYADRDYADSVTQDLFLPVSGVNSTISWESSNTSLITNDGRVTRPTDESGYVTLTATFTDDEGVSTKKEFVVKVIKQFDKRKLLNCTLSDIEDINGGEMPYIWIDGSTGNIDFILGKYTDYIVESPEEAIYSLNALKELYGIKDPENEYEFLQYYDLDTHKRIRLQQMYNGVPVWQSHLIITTDKAGNITSLNGSYDRIEGLSVAPVSTISEVNGSIGTAVENENGDMYICNKNGEFVLCWEIYNTNDGNTYMIQDGTLEVVEMYANKSHAYSYDGEEFEIVASMCSDIGESKSYKEYHEPWDVRTYAEIDKDKLELYEDINSIGGKSWIKYYSNNGGAMVSKYMHFSDEAEGVMTNFALAFYGKNILGSELYDLKNDVMYLSMDNRLNVIEYNDTDNIYYNMAVKAMSNVNRALDFYRNLGLKDISEVNGTKSQEELDENDYLESNGYYTKKSRTLYVVLSDGTISSSEGSTGGYNNKNKILELGVNGDYKACENFDIIVHELAHGILNNKIGLVPIESNSEVAEAKNTNYYSAAVHEAYGDIMACLASDNNWHIMKNNIDEGNSSRNIAAIATMETGDLGAVRVKVNGKTEEYVKVNNPKELEIYQTKVFYNKVPENVELSANCHNISTILSSAAYRMYANGIDKELLAKIWYNSMSELNLKRIDFEELAASVMVSAMELNCDDEQLNIIRKAFTDSNIYPGGNLVYGKAMDAFGNAVNEYNAYIGGEYKLCREGNKYFMFIYPKEVFRKAVITYTSDNCLDHTYTILENFGFFNIKIHDVIFDSGTVTCTVRGQVTCDQTHSDGMKVTLISDDGNLVFTTEVIGNHFLFLNVPYGFYNINVEDTRELEYEGERRADYTKRLILRMPVYNILNIIPTYKYHLIKYTLYNDIDGVKSPMTYVDFEVRERTDNSVWFKSISDSDGSIYFPNGGGNYDIYVDGKLVKSYCLGGENGA